jgi:hypothetical protein
MAKRQKEIRMKILILDDDLCRHQQFNKRLIGHSVTNVSESKEAINKIQENVFDIIFLDHDLGGKIHVQSGENTGYEVALWLNKNEQYHKGEIVIHSFNPVGAANMKALLPHAKVIPGAWLLIESNGILQGASTNEKR